MQHDPLVQQAVNTYQLGLPRMPLAGSAGELLGRGTGSSLEFQEFREYLPGDDIRHLDWAAYARSDTLMVRLYREEISPRTEILLDASASMKTGEGLKPQLARQLTALFALLTGRVGGRCIILPVTDEQPVEPLGPDGLNFVAQMPFSGTAGMDELLARNAVPLKKQAVRIVISDFLFPHDPESLIRRLASGASALWIVQLLSDWEADPQPLGGRRLTDVETGSETDLIIDRPAIDAYAKRLKLLQSELIRNCRRVHARFVSLVAGRGLETLCREDLCAAEMLRAK